MTYAEGSLSPGDSVQQDAPCVHKWLGIIAGLGGTEHQPM